MAFVGTITNGQVGSSIRTQLNHLVEHTNKNSGWANYADSAHTSSSPLVVAEGVTVNLTNNANAVIHTQLPQGTTALYDGTRVTPDADGDVYDIRIAFKAASSAHAGSFSVTCDTSAAGDGSNIVFTKSASTILNVNTVQSYSFPANFFVDSTFKANGGLLQIKSISGILSLHDFTIFINKVHAAR